MGDQPHPAAEVPDCEFWNDVDDDFLLQASQMVDRRVSQDKGGDISPTDLAEMVSLLNDDDSGEWDDDGHSNGQLSRTRQQRFEQTQTIFQRGPAPGTSTRPSASSFQSSFNEPEFKKPRMARNAAIDRPPGQHQEVEELKRKLEQAQLEAKRLNEEKYEKSGEVIFLRGELSKRDQALEKFREDHQQEIELKNERMKQIQLKSKDDVEKVKVENEFLKEDIRNLKTALQAKKRDTPQEVPLAKRPAKTTEDASLVSSAKRRKGVVRAPPSIDRTFFEVEQTTNKSPRKKPSPIKTDTSAQTVSSVFKRRKFALTRWRSGNAKESPQNAFSLLRAIDSQESLGALSNIIDQCGDSLLSKIIRSDELRDHSVIKDKTVETLIRAINSAGFNLLSTTESKRVSSSPEALASNIRACQIVIHCLRGHAERLDDDLLKSFVLLGKTGFENLGRFEAFSKHYFLLLRTMIVDEVITRAHLQDFFATFRSGPKSLQDDGQVTYLVHCLELLVASAEVATLSSALCEQTTGACLVAKIASIISATISGCAGSTPCLSLKLVLIMCQKFLNWLTAAIGRERPWIAPGKTNSCSVCRTDVIKATTTMTANLLLVLEREQPQSLIRECLLCLRDMWSFDPASFVSSLGESPTVQRQYIWITSHLDRLKATLNLDPLEDSSLIDLMVEREMSSTDQ